MKAFFPLFVITCISFAACKTGSRTTVKNIVTAQRNIMPPDSIILKQKNGIDLFAVGNNPAAWSLEIDFDKMVSFRSADGNRLNVLAAFDKKEISALIETYRLQTDQGTVIIQVFNEPCSVSGSNEQFNKRTTVHLKNKLYTGCAKYLFDHQLNDSWILESVNGIKQSAADYAKGLPRMEFDLQTNKMTGSDGCNNISSNIEVKGNRIKFSPFTGTRMSCSNNKTQKIFAEMLSDQLVDYYLENSKLILYLRDDSKIIFTRRSF